MSNNNEESKPAEAASATNAQSIYRSPKKSQNNNKKDVNFRKRRYTVGADAFKSYQKKRRKDDFIPPTMFKLGGNIHDPLNLNGISASGSSQAQITPESSPSPFMPNKEKVEVLIPPNICDPLNLSCPEGLNEADLISPTSLKSKRNKRRRTSSETEVTGEKTFELKGFHDKFKDDSFLTRRNISNLNRLNRDKFNANSADKKTISPVTSKGNTRCPRNYSGNSHSKDGGKKNERHFFEKQEASTSASGTTAGPTATGKSAKAANKNERFRFGNYNRYYGYRNVQHCDPRIELFRKDLFEGKDVLDVGCNIGHVTLTIARDFAPRKVVGVDIDSSLIEVATKNIRHYITEQVVESEQMPISMPLLYGPIASLPKQSAEAFPNNVLFFAVNYVPETDDFLQNQQAEYDCILCLSLTKWIHLNWGDEGMKRMFKRIFLHLRPGGSLLLEPQPWSSYHKKSKLTPQTMENFRSIRFKPEHFNEFLLKDVGFKSCELLGTPSHMSKGFQRPIYMYTKAK